MFDPRKLTYKSQETISAAAKLAMEHKHPAMEPIHLLVSLLESDGPAREVVDKLVDDLEQVTNLAYEQLKVLPTSETGQEPRMTQSVVDVFQTAAKLGQDSGEEFLSQDMLLLALLKTDKKTQEIFATTNVSYQDVQKEVESMKQGAKADSPTSDSSYNVLEKYTINLTQRAREGKLDPVIGRDGEIRRVMQVLSRRRKNNPVLIGDPGVGKTAIVEGLALRIMSGDVPESLRSKEVLVLEIASVLAGAKYRGEFEERIKSILKQIESQPDKYIVFIDELHTIVGAGSAEGAVDASNMLKPGLARGELHLIGATTLNEYRQYIEKDSALERRFQPVFVQEPSHDDAIAILRGLKEKYEVHHGLGIRDDAITAAVELSTRYISDRFLPDKAIDLLDEAASGIKIESESKPEVLDNLSRKITQLEIEKKALESDKNSKDKLDQIEQELGNLKEEAQTLETRWRKQQEQLDRIKAIRQELDSLKIKLEEAERNVELDEAAKIKYGTIPTKQKELQELEQAWSQIPASERLIKDMVSAEDVANVVARWTGIPVSRLLKSEIDKLVKLEEELSRRVIGQKEALEAVANAVRRSRAGLADENKPTATFLFLGPTGVGKTETAKALAHVLFNDQKALVRIDMSEYGERHSVARLIGSPPGYVGHEEGGQLTEVVRRRPYSLILFDEIEKAHDDVFNVFLQIFDDGRLTDGRGRTVDFKNTVIIMTSNLGSQLIQEHSGSGAQLQTKIWELLKDKFRPEFINRIDQIIIYDKLEQKQLEEIVNLELDKIRQRLDKQSVGLELSDAARAQVAKEGYDPVYGARPLKRYLQTRIVDHLALMITKGELNPGSSVTVDWDNDQGYQFQVK